MALAIIFKLKASQISRGQSAYVIPSTKHYLNKNVFPPSLLSNGYQGLCLRR